MHDLRNLVSGINDRDRPVTVFFRDDDGGWANERLEALCDRFVACGTALDLAVIPGALDTDAEFALRRNLRRHGDLLHLHQHGYTHTNHQHSGRKCEFGNDRDLQAQRRDIVKGRSRLQEMFGDWVEPIFTPPWNRCTSSTCAALAGLNFAGISRVAGSSEIDCHGLVDVSIAVDWQKSRAGVRLSRPDFFQYANRRFAEHDVVGVMLHHELMDDEELAFFTAFLEALQKSSNVEFRSMIQITESRYIEDVAREYSLT